MQEFKDFLTETGNRLLAMHNASPAVMENLSTSGEAVWQLFKSAKYSDERIVEMLKLSE